MNLTDFFFFFSCFFYTKYYIPKAKRRSMETYHHIVGPLIWRVFRRPCVAFLTGMYAANDAPSGSTFLLEMKQIRATWRGAANCVLGFPQKPTLRERCPHSKGFCREDHSFESLRLSCFFLFSFILNGVGLEILRLKCLPHWAARFRSHWGGSMAEWASALQLETRVTNARAVEPRILGIIIIIMWVSKQFFFFFMIAGAKLN